MEQKRGEKASENERAKFEVINLREGCLEEEVENRGVQKRDFEEETA